MKRLAASILLASTFFCNAPALAQSEIPVDRVILSTSGLANFMHHAEVTDNAKVEFPIRLEQVDDILKSLVVFDSKGRLGSVTLPGKQPLDQIFKDLPFRRGQLSNPAELLNAYQGAAVTVKAGKSAISGKLLRAVPEKTVVGADKEVTRHRISVMTDAGIRQAVLEDIDAVQFDDAKIRAEIARALDAVRENGAVERRMLNVSLPGSGTRDVNLSYVVDAPLWKTAYRMVVPPAGAEKGLLQGWAVVENMTAGDWNNVDMTLVSGNPVTFRQALYQSYYVDRPEIPVQVFGRVMPRVDAGALATADVAEPQRARMGAAGGAAGNMMSKMAPLAAPAPAMARRESYMADTAALTAAVPEEAFTGMDQVAQAANAAQSAEATTQVLFRFPDRVSLKSGQSMMLPFISRQVPMSRISLYQPDTHATHPLAAVEIRNDGETGLPPGVLTLYEENELVRGAAFVGDAQLPVLAQGDNRLISYALDSKTSISRTEKSDVRKGKITISGGVMKTAVSQRAETVYTIKAPPREDRVIVIEHAKRGGFKLVSPDPKSVEVTDTHYRVRVSVKGGETKVLPVALESDSWQSYGIDGMPTDALMAYATTQGDLDAPTRKAFEHLAQLRREIDAIDQQVMQLEQQRQSIFEDQERVRENLKSLKSKSDVQEKYLEKLNAQEDSIAKINAAREKLDQQRAARQAELQKAVAAISL